MYNWTSVKLFLKKSFRDLSFTQNYGDLRPSPEDCILSEETVLNMQFGMQLLLGQSEIIRWKNISETAVLHEEWIINTCVCEEWIKHWCEKTHRDQRHWHTGKRDSFTSFLLYLVEWCLHSGGTSQHQHGAGTCYSHITWSWSSLSVPSVHRHGVCVCLVSALQRAVFQLCSRFSVTWTAA